MIGVVRAMAIAVEACAMVGCASAPLGGGGVDAKALEEAMSIEKTLEGRNEPVVSVHDTWFEVREGSAGIIVTAPHSTRPFREGAYRFSDGGGTGAVAEMLHRLAGATAIVATRPSLSDPNYYDDNGFKDEIRSQVERGRPLLLIDVHGSHVSRPYDVDFGTLGGKSVKGGEGLLERLVAALREEGIDGVSHNHFSAARNQTITKFAARLGVPAIQMEINKKWLTPSSDEAAAKRFARLLRALVKFVRSEGRPVSVEK